MAGFTGNRKCRKNIMMEKFIQLAIKYGLIAKEDLSIPCPYDHGKCEHDDGFFQIAKKHYCGVCEKWFATVAGAAGHRRWKHKE